MKRITLKDVAKACGCSANCVSRALMDAPDISAATKHTVRRTAEEMGYVINSQASALRKGNSNSIAILCDSLLNPFYSVMTHYMQSTLKSRGYNFVTFYSERETCEEKDIRQIVSAGASGLISFLAPDQKASQMLTRQKMPTVVLGRKSPCFDSVVLDNVGGGRLAAEYLLSRGATGVAYIGDHREMDCSLDRGEGYADVMKRHGLQPQSYFVDRNSTFQTIIRDILQSQTQPDALFCFNDFAAYIVLQELSERGVQKAVCGFDDIRKELSFYGKMPTVGYDKQSFADKALNRLFLRIEGDKSQAVTEIQPVWLVAEQCAE